MYDWLCRWMPPRFAAIALMCWYVLLLLAILWCLNATPGEFRYAGL